MAGVELILPLGAVTTKLRGSSWLFHAWESLELASLKRSFTWRVMLEGSRNRLRW